MKATGITSTSFRLWAATFAPSLGTLVDGLAQKRPASVTVTAIIGMIVPTATKHLHDLALNNATIANAGSDLATQLPQLRADLAKTVGFVETDFPAAKSQIEALKSRAEAVEAAVANMPALSVIINAVKADLFPQPVVQTPEPPAPTA